MIKNDNKIVKEIDIKKKAKNEKDYETMLIELLEKDLNGELNK